MLKPELKLPKVMFTNDREKVRIEQRELPSWSIFETYRIVEAVRSARDNGWYEKKVQVRAERNSNGEYIYYVEPFERDCNCPNILKYSDYFDPPDTNPI